MAKKTNLCATINVLIILSCLSVMAATVSGADFTYVKNLSKLPFNTTENIGVHGTVNMTANITYINFTSGPATLRFNSNLSVLTVKVNVPKTTKPGNYTNIVKMRNNVTNYSINITFNFKIVNDTPKTVIPYIITPNGEEYTFCDYALPINFTKKDISIISVPGQTVYVRYDPKFFSMPVEFVMPNKNYTLIDIYVHLKNLTPGKYTKSINFSVGKSASLTYIFNIKDCVQPPPDIDEFLASCRGDNLTVEQYMKCLDGQSKYWTDLYHSALSTQKERVINNTVIEYLNNTEMVPVLRLDDPELIQALKDLPTVYMKMLTDNRNKDATIQKLNQQMESNENRTKKELEQITQQYNIKVERLSVELHDSLDGLINKTEEQENQINVYKEKYIKKSSLWWTFALLVVIGIVSLIAVKIWEDSLW